MDLDRVSSLQRVPMPQTMHRTFESTAVIGEYITNMKDVQRHQEYEDNDALLKHAQKLAASTHHFGTRTIVLTNTDQAIERPGLTVTKVPLFTGYNQLTLYFYRWEMAFTFLKQHPEIEKVFFVDLTDVQMRNYPFDHLQPGKLYFGDELSDLSADIIQAHATLATTKTFFAENKTLQVLNPGVVGGYRDVVMAFLGSLTVHIANAEATDQLAHQPNTIGNLEMALVNYVAYHDFSDCLVHGRLVASRLAFHEPTTTAWFQHK